MGSVPEKTEPTSDDMNEEIGPDVTVPGPFPSVSDHRDAGEPSPQSEPTGQTRGAGSLGDLTQEVSTSTMREETGGLGSPIHDDEKRGARD